MCPMFDRLHCDSDVRASRDANYIGLGSRFCILRPELITASFQAQAAEALKPTELVNDSQNAADADQKVKDSPNAADGDMQVNDSQNAADPYKPDSTKEEKLRMSKNLLL
ncbi:hypothetical protein VNO80_18554 [Phaseolus coccineus]|uniref:Uncharacterized protein n=1 Tax=Phaseolus coccineus TaxID=3886 RepID=A0AAN9ME05_PHACN